MDISPFDNTLGDWCGYPDCSRDVVTSTPAAAEHAAAPAAAVAPEHKMEEHADHAKKAPKKAKKAHKEEMKKEEAPKAEEAHH